MFESITTQSLAEMLGAEMLGPADIKLTDLAGIDEAGPGSVTFIRSSAYAKRWAKSEASAAIATRSLDIPGHDPTARTLLLVDDADQSLVALLNQLAKIAAPPAPPRGIHPSAIIDPTATIDPTAAIGPLCIVGENAAIGADAVLYARVTIGRHTTIGPRTVMHPNVVVYHHCVIGSDCLFHAQVSIGADGFGFIPHPSGTGLIKVPHLGNVVIGDHVEVGAGACIDRGKFASTTIGHGTKIDNLVQIGHNVKVGAHAVLCGQVGLGGSTVVGNGAMLGGQVGVQDNKRIGDGALIGGKSGVMQHIPPGESWFGTPARPANIAFRSYRTNDRVAKTVRDLKERVEALEAQLAARAEADRTTRTEPQPTGNPDTPAS